MTPTIRTERAGDEAAVRALTEAAFRGQPHSDGSEAAIIDRLRGAGDLTLSLVAELAGEPVGHVAFSPVEISDSTTGWYGLGRAARKICTPTIAAQTAIEPVTPIAHHGQCRAVCEWILQSESAPFHNDRHPHWYTRLQKLM